MPSAASNPARRSAALAGLFPEGATACELREPAGADLLLPAEAAGMGRCAPQRIQDFTGGRLCARLALSEFGIEGFALAVGKDRQVVWPEGMVGSITHTTGLCAAAVAERRKFAALGLDSEVVGDVRRNVWPRICGTAEIEWLERLPPQEQAAGAAVIFAAKEAFYKCQYPLAGERPGFHDVEVLAPQEREWRQCRGGLLLRPLRPLAFESYAAVPFSGRFLLQGGFASAGLAASAAGPQ